jgi:hypothetical protein
MVERAVVADPASALELRLHTIPLAICASINAARARTGLPQLRDRSSGTAAQPRSRPSASAGMSGSPRARSAAPRSSTDPAAGH